MEKEKYQHYKGNFYQVLLTAKHTETHEDFIIYQDLSDKSKVWARSKKMFFEKVVVNGKKLPRFKLIK